MQTSSVLTMISNQRLPRLTLYFCKILHPLFLRSQAQHLIGIPCSQASTRLPWVNPTLEIAEAVLVIMLVLLLISPRANLRKQKYHQYHQKTPPVSQGGLSMQTQTRMISY